jgi:benzoate membrane transport protein
VPCRSHWGLPDLRGSDYLAGFTGWFERLMNRIPLSLAAGMLAGVLLRFGLDVFTAMQTQFAMIFAMFCTY